MSEHFSDTEQYEPSLVEPSSKTQGLTRRNVLKALAALSFTPSVYAQQGPGHVPVHKLHLFGLKVSDVERSVKFYQDIFGAPIQSRYGNTVCLRIGEGPMYFSISPTAGSETPGISHIGLSVPDFNVDKIVAELSNHGFIRSPGLTPGRPKLSYAMKTWTHRRSHDAGHTRDLYLADMEGLVFQLCSTDHCGGGGNRGQACDALEPSPTEGFIELVGINHFTNYMSNAPRANAFYKELFGLDYLSYQGPNFPTVGVGDGKQFLMYVGGQQEGTPTSPARIDHVSMSVKDFDVEGILAKLSDYGLSAREDASETPPLSHWVSMRMANRGGAEEGTPELYFSDPDGIHIQLQHVDYCGGSGYLGDSCPAL
ncbi:MAG: VOC family protein [Pseudohongiellaceae bacterium]|nr:VOC family protein [Pseudohongiellaceae bacterium]